MSAWRAPRAFAALPALPADDGEPVFAEPWEAHAFALAVELSERGVFTWTEWSEALGAELERARGAGDPDLGDTYYRHWLKALERLLTEKGVVDGGALGSRERAWREAYLKTPHGRPVELE